MLFWCRDWENDMEESLTDDSIASKFIFSDIRILLLKLHKECSAVEFRTSSKEQFQRLNHVRGCQRLLHFNCVFGIFNKAALRPHLQFYDDFQCSLGKKNDWTFDPIRDGEFSLNYCYQLLEQARIRLHPFLLRPQPQCSACAP